MDVPAPSTNDAPAPKQQPSLLRLTWPSSAQLAAAFLLGCLLTLIAVHAYSRTRWGTRPAELERGLGVAYRIDLNRASRVELLQLPGIGENLAQRIEDYRTENGPFRKVNDLIEVRGIGPATLERLRPWVQVKLEDDDSMTDGKENPRQPADVKKQNVPGKGNARTQKTSQKEANLTSLIDLNHASATELQRLPGIGPKMSQRIVEAREKSPFKSVDDLRRIHGIGAKTLDRLRPYVTVRTDPVRIASAEQETDAANRP